MKFKLAIIIALNIMVSISQAGKSEYDESFAKLEAKSLKERILFRGEVFVTDSSGLRLIAQTTEVREWRPGKNGQIEVHWAMASKDFKEMAIHLAGQIKDDNSIDIKFEQYERMDNPEKPKYTKLLREETLKFENFGPMTYLIDSNKDARLIARITPLLESVKEGESLDKLIIGGDRGTFQVTDNKGYLWADNVRFGGVYAGLISHRGSLALSYYPFPGAREMGYAYGKTIHLDVNKDLSVKIKSETDLIPGEMRVKVYGRYLPELKTSRPNSTTSWGMQKPDGMPKEFR